MSYSRAIRVVARERPSNGRDGILHPPSLTLDEGASTAESYHAESGKVVKIKTDGCYGPDRSQEEVWEGVSAVLDEVKQGKNATIFAYGVTGSGKTHTMQGTIDQPGLIFRTIESIYQLPNLDKVRMSLVEILNDQVYDLMSGDHKKLDIRSDGFNNYIPLMTVEPVDSVEHFEELFSDAAGQRATASTKLNAQSSRSHSILMLDLEMTDMASGKPIRAKLRLIDLAGSENNNRTGNDRERLRESAAINQSLTSLGNVIDAINQGTKPVYRESKLTRILEDVLGGESRGVMICCLAPGAKFAKDAYNTLCFAQRASGLKARTVTHQPRASMAARRSTIGAPSRPRPSIKVFQESTAPVRPIARAPLRAVQNGVVPATKAVNYLSKADVERMLEPTLQQNAQLIPRVVELESANAEMSRRLEETLTQVVVQPNMTEDEKQWYAKICVREARLAQDSEDYPRAIALYRRALVHKPDAERINTRIAEIGLIMDGTLPRPAAAAKRGREAHLTSATSAAEVESPFKRIRFAE